MMSYDRFIISFRLNKNMHHGLFDLLSYYNAWRKTNGITAER